MRKNKSNTKEELPTPTDSVDTQALPESTQEKDGKVASPNGDADTQTKDGHTSADDHQALNSGQVYEDPITGRRLTPLTKGEVRRSPRAALLDIMLHDQMELEVNVPINEIGDVFMYKFLKDLEAGKGYDDYAVSKTAVKAVAAEIVQFQKYIGLIYSQAKDPKEWVNVNGETLGDAKWPWERILTPGKWYPTRDFWDQFYVSGEETQRIIEPLRNAGLSDEAINYILTKAMEQADKELIGKTVLPLALRHSLETEMFEFGTYDSPEFFSYDNVLSSIKTCQAIYGRACLQLTLDAFAADLSRFTKQDQRIAFTLNINRLLRESQAPSLPVPFSALMESIAPAMSQEPVVQGRALLNGLIYKVDTIAPDLDLDDVSRPALMEFVFQMLRDYTGLEAQVQNWEVEKAIDLDFALNNPQRHWRLAWPIEVLRADPNSVSRFVDQTSLETAFEKLRRLFKRVFFRSLMRTATLRDEGSLMAAFLSVLDERAITRSDTWDYVVTTSLRAVSTFHQAYCDTFMFFYQLAVTDDILWANESRDEYRDLLIKFFTEETDKFRATHVNREEPAYAKEASALFGGAIILPKPTTISWTYEDATLTDRNEKNFDPFTGTYRFLYAHDILEGDMFGMPARLDELQKKIYQRPEYSRLKSGLHVQYHMTRDISSIFSATDFGVTFLRFQDISTLKQIGLFEWFKARCTASVFLSAHELAVKFGIPDYVAQVIFKVNGLEDDFGYYTVFRYSSAIQQTIVWDEELAPIYELGIPRDDDPRFYKRFKALWPAVVEGTVKEYITPLYELSAQ